MKAQLKELASNDMLKALFPNLTKIGEIYLSIPVMIALVESFSQMKLIKTRSTSSLNDKSFSNLMKIALESPVELFTVWNRKSRMVVVFWVNWIQCSI